MAYRIVDYEEKYLDDCADLVKDMWQLHEYFKDMKDESCIYKAFLRSCLAGGVYRQMILTDQDELVGILFGSRKQMTFKQKLTSHWSMAKLATWVLYKLIKGDFGDRSVALESMRVMQGIQSQGEEYYHKFDSVVDLFIVNKEHRGCKLGYKLMRNFIGFCYNNDIKNTCLWTDLGCTYSFYDRFGFKIYKKFHNSHLTNGNSGEDNGLIYCLNIEETL